MSRFRRAGVFAALCSVGAAALLSSSASAETLADAIALAYQTNPTLQEQRASQRALDESIVQARTGYRPTVGFTADATQTDLRPHTPTAANPKGTFSSTGATLSADQPLYTGGRVSADVEAAQAQVLAGREGLRGVEQDVLLSVVRAYVDVRRDVERLRITTENVAVLQRQLDEAQARFEVGEITRTDVAQSQARLAGARAARASAEAQLAISRANYAAAVGQNPTELAQEPSLGDLLPQTVDQAFAQAQVSSPQLRAADYSEQASRARLALAKAQRLPSVSAQASVGYDNLDTGRSVPFDDYDRTVVARAVVTLPLFSGGLVSSQIRQAAELNNADRIAVEGARRAVLQQVSQAWNGLIGSRENVIANQEQVRATQVAFEGVRQEQQVGLRTTLDVLNAEQELRNAELALVNARHDEYVSAAALLAAMGVLDTPRLAQVTPYDPDASARKAVRAFGWVPWEPAVEAIDHVGVRRTEERPADAPIATQAPGA